MKKAFTLPVVIVFIILFISVPLVFLFSITRQKNNVKGAQATPPEIENGFLVYVSSKSAMWDLNEYLCATQAECAGNLMSGKKWGVVSSGASQRHEVVVQATKEWDQYNYMKLFVKSPYGGGESQFSATLSTQGLGTVEKITYENQTYDVVIVSLDEVKSGVHLLAEFLD